MLLIKYYFFHSSGILRKTFFFGWTLISSVEAAGAAKMKNANNFLGCRLIFLIFWYVTTYLHAINTQLLPEMGPVTLIISLSTGIVCRK